MKILSIFINLFSKNYKNNNQNEFEDNDLMKIGGSGTGMSRYPVRPVFLEQKNIKCIDKEVHIAENRQKSVDSTCFGIYGRCYIH